LGLALAVGCSTKPTGPVPADEEPAVRATFAEFQAAVKARDADKLWGLLSSKSRADAERVAQTIRTAYSKTAAGEKANQEEELGLTRADLAGLTGARFITTRRFWGKFQDVPGSAIDRVTVQGDSATLHYTEVDGDKEK
jgi:hypothetical protein